jgi:hypothetical protein
MCPTMSGGEGLTGSLAWAAGEAFGWTGASVGGKMMQYCIVRGKYTELVNWGCSEVITWSVVGTHLSLFLSMWNCVHIRDVMLGSD